MTALQSLLLALASMASALNPAWAQTVGPKQAPQIERFGADSSPGLLVLLHGADGPSLFYRDQAAFFAAHGYFVVLPHFLDAGHGQAPTDANLQSWVDAVQSALAAMHDAHFSSTVIVGYSLGASLALAIGSQEHGPDAVAEFSGSLPDRYFRDLKGMPPLLILHGDRDTVVPVSNARALSRLCEEAALHCQSEIYPDQGHHFTRAALASADQRVLEFFAAVAKPASAEK